MLFLIKFYFTYPLFFLLNVFFPFNRKANILKNIVYIICLTFFKFHLLRFDLFYLLIKLYLKFVGLKGNVKLKFYVKVV